MGNRIIRETTPEDTAQILALYPQAFPGEELRPLVSALLAWGPEVLSLATFQDGELSAHAIFTVCRAGDMTQAGALLGPLGVMPSLQRQGVGSALVRAGLERLREMGITQVFVLGDPAWYRRFGFAPERQVLTPYPIPAAWAEAWQSLTLDAGGEPGVAHLSLPEPWMDPALWGP